MSRVTGRINELVEKRFTVPVSEVRGFKMLGDDAGGFSGYANPFGKLDSVGDITMPGAFAPALPGYLLHGFNADNHDWAIRLGYPVNAFEDDYGLFNESRFHSTQRAQDRRIEASERLAVGMSERLSIGFTIAEFEYVKGVDAVQYLINPTPEEIDRCVSMSRVRLIHKVKQLFEVSLVSVPAAAGSDVTEVKTGVTGTLATKSLDASDTIDLVAMCAACCLACAAMCRQCAAMTDDATAKAFFRQCAEICQSMYYLCDSCQWVCYAPATNAILRVCLSICATCCTQCADICAECAPMCPTDATRDLMTQCVAVCTECAAMCAAAIADADAIGGDDVMAMGATVAAITKSVAETGALAAEIISKSTVAPPAERKVSAECDDALAAVTALHTRLADIHALRTKAGRRISRATRELLEPHPAALRAAADAVDLLLAEDSSADGEITAVIGTEKSADATDVTTGDVASTAADNDATGDTATVTDDAADDGTTVDPEIANGIYAAFITEHGI